MCSVNRQAPQLDTGWVYEPTAFCRRIEERRGKREKKNAGSKNRLLARLPRIYLSTYLSARRALSRRDGRLACPRCACGSGILQRKQSAIGPGRLRSGTLARGFSVESGAPQMGAASRRAGDRQRAPGSRRQQDVSRSLSLALSLFLSLSRACAGEVPDGQIARSLASADGRGETVDETRARRAGQSSATADTSERQAPEGPAYASRRVRGRAGLGVGGRAGMCACVLGRGPGP